MSTSGRQVCLACQMPDPTPEMTCTLGRDHRVGLASGRQSSQQGRHCHGRLT